MPKYEGKDRYLYDGTAVLKNKLGITDNSQLQTAEANITTIQSNRLAMKPLKGNFDIKHLQAIHKFLFRNIYAWAGKIRNVDLSKSNTYFANHNCIIPVANELFAKLAAEKHLSGLLPEQFADSAAYYLGEINAIHPFRDGNGRAQREFINHLAYKNGYCINWKNISRTEMLEASIEAFHSEEPTKLSTLIIKALQTVKISNVRLGFCMLRVL
jgi:cell filamentation protein